MDSKYYINVYTIYLLLHGSVTAYRLINVHCLYVV